TYTPSLWGTRNIVATNNSGLTNPTAFAFVSEIQTGSSGTAPSGNQTPDLGGFDFFTNGAWWQALGSPQTGVAVAPNSSALIAAFGSGNLGMDFCTTTANGGNSMYEQPYNVVAGNQPLVPLSVWEYPSPDDP